MKKGIKIEGMSCKHCVMHVKNALEELNGVNDVQVELDKSYAVVDVAGVSDEDIKAAIEDAGYDVVEIINL